MEATKDKCEIFFTGIDKDIKESICQELAMQRGTLPFKNLGVPLASNKLRYDECKSLVEHITKPVSLWTFKFLSHGVRIYLIKSVLNSIKAY